MGNPTADASLCILSALKVNQPDGSKDSHPVPVRSHKALDFTDEIIRLVGGKNRDPDCCSG